MNRYLDDINEHGLKARGMNELVRHMHGDRLTMRQRIIAKCYDCMGYYADGRGVDCEIPHCPLYPVMPYGKKDDKPKRILSDEHKQKMRSARASKMTSNAA